MWVRLSTQDKPLISHVGGKAASLIRLRQGGFTVPNGVVLTTEFFDPWISEVEASEAWQSIVSRIRASRTRLPGLAEREWLTRTCDQVKQYAERLLLTDEQRAALVQICSDLGETLCAVRSSSPEEDLAGASFAGLYETVLGVAPDSLEPAVRACFVSCLDARVLLYKRQMDFENLSPAIAVVIQQKVESEISGVAFSLNPLTNDFDEALINASWGLGEALVSGEITPDSIVVKKITGAVIDMRPGDKGGDRPDELCLNSDQIAELTGTVKRIETLYDEPVDVEWAICRGRFHILQARPITAYVPLAKELQTEPGAPRFLYMDGALTDGLTISGAISPITLDTFEWVHRLMIDYMIGVPAAELDLIEAGLLFGGSRFYVNFSKFMHLMGSGKQLARQAASTNTLMAEILVSTDLSQYRPERPPPEFRVLNVIRFTPRILWRCRELFKWGFKPLRRKRFLADYAEALKHFDEWVAQPIDHSEPFSKSVIDGYIQVAATSLRSTGPALIYYIYAGTDRVKRLIDSGDPQQVELADALCRGYPDDQIVQMGLKMYDLANLLPEAEFSDLDELLEKINRRGLPDDFLDLWDAFIDQYGCRGPLEMELANPGYGEEPLLALQQIATIALSGKGFNPHETQRRLIEEREHAYEKLLTIFPRRKRKRLMHSYDNILTYCSCRELIKHHIMQVNERLRQRLLRFAEEFITQGRLDERRQIFELSMNEIDRGRSEADFDLRAAAEARGAPYRKVKAHVRHFPMIMDSRGRILRPEAKRDDGVLAGSGVSPGIARGPVKVLNDPFEKEVLPGDVLVAVTTDPGWTPLFINAGAVLLEIGGELQHGALVAREYGKPCVAGIADVTTRLQDGQMVEVDGNTGTVRVVDQH